MTYEEAQALLREMAGVDNYRARFFAGTNRDSYTASGVARKPVPMRKGEFRLKAGEEPTQAEIMRFMKMHNSAEKAQGRSAQAAGATAPAPGSSGTSDLRSMLDKLAADYQSQVDAANAANEARYGEGKRELTDLRTRNQERVGNWGEVQRQLNEERAAENLGSINANLAARGLGNSNILAAHSARNARNLGLVQQDLSERKDDRISRYDTADTQNLVGFIERRTDRAPDQAPLTAIASKLGEAEAYRRGQEALQASINAMRGGGGARGGAVPGGVSPYAAMTMQRNAQAMNPMNAAMAWFGGRRQPAPSYGGNNLPNGGWFNPENKRRLDQDQAAIRDYYARLRDKQKHLSGQQFIQSYRPPLGGQMYA